MPTPQDNQIQGATRPGPNLPIGSKDKSVGWYDPPITEVSPAVRDLLEVYAGIPAEEVIPRILEVVRSFLFLFFLPSFFFSFSPPSVFSHYLFLPLFLPFIFLNTLKKKKT